MRCLARALVFLCLMISYAGSPALTRCEPDEKAASLFLPIYLAEAEEGVTFTAYAPSVELQVKSASPMSLTRPLLIIIDPASYSIPQLGRRVAALVEALGAELADRSQQKIRVGIPTLDGILIDLPENAVMSPADLVSAIMRLMPDTRSEQQNEPGRTLDLVATLMQKAEAGGDPVDCLWVGKDRRFEGENSAYLSLGAERRLLEECGRKGSVVHSYLEGAGGIGPICTASGGVTFAGEDEPRKVIRQVLDIRKRGFVLEMQPKGVLTLCGRFELTIRAAGRTGKVLDLRAPAAMWHLPEDTPAAGYDSMREALEWIGRAKNAADNGDAATAARFMQNGVQLDRGNPDVFYYSAKYTSEAGEIGLAEAHMATLMAFVPRTERVLVLYGDLFRKLGKSATALETLNSLSPGAVPDSAPLRLTVARLLSALGRDEEAEKIYANFPDLGRDNPQAHAEYGCLLQRLGKEAAASEQIQAALALDPQNVAALLCFAEIDSINGRIQKAMETAQRAVTLRPEDPEVYLQIGKIRGRAHQWESALASFEKAGNIAPARSDILLHLAEAEIESGHGQEAVLTMRRALAINPLDGYAIRRISGLFARAGAFTNAAAVLEDGAAKIPDLAPAFYREAAGLRERVEEYGQALLDYQAVQLSPPSQISKAGPELSTHQAYLSLMVNATAEHFGKTAKTAPAGDAPGIIVPGGLAPLAGILGLNPGALRDAAATGKVFSAILDTLPSTGNTNKLTRLQSEILDHFRAYDRLLQHLRRKGIPPQSADGAGQRQRYVLPLTGDDRTINQTKKFLSFFGIKYSSKQKGGKTAVTLSVSHDPLLQPEQQLLRRLGIDIEAQNLREIRFTTGDEILPAIIHADLMQGRILGLPNGDPRHLLTEFIRRTNEMKLYLALEDCPAPWRAALLQTFSGRELIPMTQILESLGRFLDYKPDGLVLPTTWVSSVGAPRQEPLALLRQFLEYGRGKLVYTYYALTCASPSVQRLFTASSNSLEMLTNLLVPDNSSGASPTHWNPEAVRLVRMLTADKQRLVLPVNPRFVPYLLPRGSEEGISLKDIAGLAQSGTKSNPLATPGAGAGLIEFARFIQDVQPEILTDDVIKTIMHSPAEFQICLDLIWDVHAPADLLLPYFAYCRDTAQARDTAWNVNRTRTSQSLFFLISALCREGVIDTRTGQKLLKAALESFAATEESAFLENVSAFLTDAIWPELASSLRMPADSPGLLSEALAGPIDRKAFLFNGAPLVQDAHTEQLQRIKGVLGLQHLAAITDLLQTVQLAKRIQGSRERHIDWLQNLAAAIRKLPAPAPAAANSQNKVQSSAPNAYEAIARELEVPSDPIILRDYPAWVQRVSKQVAAALHAELGIALLGHCYAYEGSPQSAVLNYDPDFIRKHDFYPRRQPALTGWLGAELLEGQESERGGIMTGSLAGLQMQLNRLETAASALNFGKWGPGKLLPAMITTMREIHPQLRTDRAQEYVALSTRLGREMLALCLAAPASHEWCDQHLSALVSPLRRNQIADLGSRGDPTGALELLSPSELFFLGQAYLAEVGILPALARQRLCAYACDIDAPLKAPIVLSPALERLREMTPAEGSKELNDFQREVDQYGCAVRQRLGISDLALRFCDSYERLQNSASPDYLFDRIIDLKIRLAETGYAAGTPAAVAGMIGELALQYLVADPALTGVGSWNDLMKEIVRLGPAHQFLWMEELLNRGSLAVYSEIR